MKTPRMTTAVQGGLGVVLLALLMLPQLRHALEASMSLHMLVQYPALMLAGALLGAALPKTIRAPVGVERSGHQWLGGVYLVPRCVDDPTRT